MTPYRRWISSPSQDMPSWARRVISLVAGVAGYAASFGMGSGLGIRLLVYAAVSSVIMVAPCIVWRATHKEAEC